MKAWYVCKGDENVTIYDSLDKAGNGNVRFRGTIDCALTHLAFAMQECDELRVQLDKAIDEIKQLQPR